MLALGALFIFALLRQGSQPEGPRRAEARLGRGTRQERGPRPCAGDAQPLNARVSATPYAPGEGRLALTGRD